MAVGVKRVYSNFAGVDFINDASVVALNRSPDALNVWKNYNDVLGGCIETRPGFSLIGTIGTDILGLYVYNSSTAIVHSGNKLYKWSNFPETPTAQTLTELYTSMSTTQKSVFNKFKDKLYINDGTNYLYFDGTNIGSVESIAYIPTTSIGRSPSGGGEMLEDVNVLQPTRKNTFLGDGTSTDYYLDSTNIDSVDSVYVNDVLKTAGTDYTVNTTLGKIVFTTAPSVPAVSGQDNVYVTFSKTVNGYANRIKKCTIALVWDNRIFFSGNSDYPNAIFHSQLDNPTYISDLKYYEDGSNDSYIKDLEIGADVLWVFKVNDQNDDNIFYHTKELDEEAGRVYPVHKGNVSVGCCSKATNYKDDILYLSRNGLEGIQTTELDSRQIIAHRSTNVDSKLLNEPSYIDAEFCEYKGYLLILTGNDVFLADGRQKYASQDSFEYEWYYWSLNNAQPRILKEYNGQLYICAKDGKIYKVDGTSDNGVLIDSYWTTIMDNFGYENKLKTTSKRGGLVKVKTIQNGKIKVSRRTNKSNEWKDSTEKNLQGFNFNGLNFANLTFTTTDQSYLVFKIKEKKINEIAIKIYSDEINKPFGVYSITLEAFIGSYVKK